MVYSRQSVDWKQNTNIPTWFGSAPLWEILLWYIENLYTCLTIIENNVIFQKDKLVPFHGCMRSLIINEDFKLSEEKREDKDILFFNTKECFSDIEEGIYFAGDGYAFFGKYFIFVCIYMSFLVNNFITKLKIIYMMVGWSLMWPSVRY